MLLAAGLAVTGYAPQPQVHAPTRGEVRPSVQAVEIALLPDAKVRVQIGALNAGRVFDG